MSKKKDDKEIEKGLPGRSFLTFRVALFMERKKEKKACVNL